MQYSRFPLWRISRADKLRYTTILRKCTGQTRRKREANASGIFKRLYRNNMVTGCFHQHLSAMHLHLGVKNKYLRIIRIHCTKMKQYFPSKSLRRILIFSLNFQDNYLERISPNTKSLPFSTRKLTTAQVL